MNVMLLLSNRSLRCLWLLFISLFVFGAGLFGRDLYWTEGSRIVASDADGTNVTVVFDGETSTPQMESYAVDIAVTGSHIYWSGHSGRDIWRANRDGSDATQIVANTGSSIHFLALSEEKGKLYFSDYAEGLLEADLPDGDNPFNSIPSEFLTGIALAASDPESPDELLVLNTENDMLQRAVPQTWTLEDEVQLPEGIETYGLAYDAESETVYYTNFGDNNLHALNLATGEHEALWTPGMMQPLGVKLSPSGTHLLIAERGRGISGYELATGGYELLVDSPDAHFGVAVTADPGTLEDPPPPPSDGDVLWSTDFQADELESLPSVNWGSIGGPETGTALVTQDTADEFGFGTDNQFLRVDQTVSFNMQTGPFLAPAEVLTLSFDFIGRFKEGDGRWLNVFIRAGGPRAHITSMRMSDATIRWAPGDPSYGGNDIPVRIETIVNNSPETIAYEDPAGETREILAERASVWAYHHTTGLWEQLAESYSYERTLGETGPVLDNIYFLVDSDSATRTFDLDNVKVTMGASLSELEGDIYVPPPPPFHGHLEADFEDVETGEITRENSDDFLHGNISRWGFHWRYDTRDADRDPADFEPSPLLVVEDTEDRFGKGAGNQVLRTNGARGWTIGADNNFHEEVMTLRIDMIAEADDNARLTSRFFDESNELVSRLEFGATGETGTFDGGAADTPGTWEYGVLNRFEAVVNNSEDPLEYSTPDGTSKTLIPGGTDMWLNGELVFEDSTYGRTGAFGPIMSYSLNTFSTNPWDADIDLVRTYSGVQLVGAEQPDAGFASWQETNFPGESDPAIIGPDADPDGDGIPNALEYVLGGNPNVPDRGIAPTTGVVEVDGESYLRLEFLRNPEVSGVTVTVEGSADLIEWTEVSGPESSEAEGELVREIWRSEQPIGAEPRGFLRVNVETTD